MTQGIDCWHAVPVKVHKPTFPPLEAFKLQGLNCSKRRDTPAFAQLQHPSKHMHQLHLCSHLSQYQQRLFFPGEGKVLLLPPQQCWALTAAGDGRGCNYPPVCPKPPLQPSSPSMQRNGFNDTWNWGLDPLTPSVSLGIFLTISWMRGLLRSHLGN